MSVADRGEIFLYFIQGARNLVSHKDAGYEGQGHKPYLPKYENDDERSFLLIQLSCDLATLFAEMLSKAMEEVVDG